MKNTFGNALTVTLFGESHGSAIGAVIDGIAPGIKIDKNYIDTKMALRRPSGKISTARSEKDELLFESGVYDGHTTGTPICILIKNADTHSSDYSALAGKARPGHADYPAFCKYHGFEDARGGGHFSGRLTAPLVFAGAIAKQILAQKGVTVGAHILSINGVYDDNFDKAEVTSEQLIAVSSKPFGVINDNIEEKMRQAVEKARLDGDSVGGIIECAVCGMPVGVGANIFSTVESHISSSLFGVPAVKGVEFGAGFDLANMTGYEANDTYSIKNGKIFVNKNNNGGILGGMTTGAPIIVKAAIKPTPSISKPQKSVNLQTMTEEELVIHGRHDPCIVPRALPVIESAVAFALLDLMA